MKCEDYDMDRMIYLRWNFGLNVELIMPQLPVAGSLSICL